MTVDKRTEQERAAESYAYSQGVHYAKSVMLQRLRNLRAEAITFERQNAYDRAIEAVEGLS